MANPPRAPRSLQAWPCQSICVWVATGEVWAADEGQPMAVIGCAGCGSEWVRSEAWTPIDAGGVVPGEVVAERAK
ncbi:MAG: hypothetical protein H0U28_12055 [Nocardioidaceae bacterium]|nr:hypothetical protein [Nocardioidaceae bacterium]